ncbi:MAG: metal-dependent hydrolase [Pirellulales bacterium]
MAGFRMHVTTSAVLGCGYAGVGHVAYGVPLDTAVVAGAMCGFSGMLPDLDSDYGVPLRETMAFTAAIVPMLLVGRFETLALSHDAMVLVAVSMYLFVRFGITNIVRKYTVHRGMFHSVPAGLIFTGIAFLVCGTAPLEIRCYKAGGVLAGFMSHLLLDEIYAVQWKGGRWRFKKSFGTALKFWGDDGWANFSTYAKLAIVVMMILGEPTVIERLEMQHPGFASQYQQFQDRFGTASIPGAQQALDAARAATSQFVGSSGQHPDQGIAPTDPFQSEPRAPAAMRNDFDTAQRPTGPYP